MPHPDDLRLLQRAQAQGALSSEQARGCLEDLAQGELAGKPLRLAQVLLRRRLLGSAEIMGLLKEGRDLANTDQSVVGEQTWTELSALVSATPQVAPGGQVAGYKLEREVARGGLGILFEARQGGERVALKVLSKEASASPNVVARFREEARLAATLSHPNLIKVHVAGTDKGVHYIVMDFFEGRSLADLVRPGSLSARKALEVCAVVARASQHMHEHGVIHRDIKPANIMVGKGGAVCLTDFGLAKDSARVDSQLTQVGFGKLLGTPAYMAPEQARGAVSEVGPWTDVYGLGAVIYRCLTGRYPFAFDSFMKTLQAIAHGPPPRLKVLRPDAPDLLDAIVAGAMATEAGRRPSMEQLARALEGVLAQGVLMPPAPPGEAV